MGRRSSVVPRGSEASGGPNGRHSSALRRETRYGVARTEQATALLGARFGANGSRRRRRAARWERVRSVALLRRFYDTPRFFGFGDAQGALFFGLFDLVRIDQEGREAFGFFEFGFVFGGFELALERADANALPEAAFGHVGG